MNLKFTVEIWDKGQWYVARCPELDFVSQGSSPEEARHNLLEVIQIQLEIIKNNMKTANMSRDEYFELLAKV